MRAKHISITEKKAECPFCHQTIQFRLADGFEGEIMGKYIPVSPCEHFVNVFRNGLGGHLVARFEQL